MPLKVVLKPLNEEKSLTYRDQVSLNLLACQRCWSPKAPKYGMTPANYANHQEMMLAIWKVSVQSPDKETT